MKVQGKKVYMAMSGGVDSSVSAALLVEAGYEVIGVFIKAWQPDFISCSWSDDRRDAMGVASFLNIPFITVNLEKEYKKHVIDYMISEYKAGRTPNPDIMCNKKIKFGKFFDIAIKDEADYIATGHYAQIIKENSGYKLLAGKDKNKDQSYFLWTLTQTQISKTLFPIGMYEKKYVRKLAHKFNLHIAEKKDSQGLCFVGKVDFKLFLKEFIDVKQGNVLNISGEIIGVHNGVILYTIGERHGFTIIKKTPADKPYYVVSKNIKKNELIVSNKDNMSKLSSKEIILDKVNWIHQSPILNKKYRGRSRYRQVLENCILKKEGNIYKAVFDTPQNIAEGQSFVLYDGEECLGGAIITGKI